MHREIPVAGNHRADDTQVDGRLSQAHSSRQVHIGVAAAKLHACLFLKHGQQQVHSVVINAHGSPPWHIKAGRGNQRLNLDEQRPGALHGADHHRAGRVQRPAVQHNLRRIGHLAEPFLFHLEYSDLVGGTKPVFDAPEDAVHSVLLAFKIQHSIHHVLQGLRACHHTLFCHMSHDKHGDALFFSKLHKNRSHLPYLADASCRRGHLLAGHGLHGVHHHHIRLSLS